MAFRGENFVHMWVNYDHDTQTVRDSYNIASVTDVGTGRLTFNFSTNANNANYAYAGIAGNANSTTTSGRTFSNEGTAVGSFSVRYRAASATLDDDLVTVICVAES
tara:strand:+ start:1400 stop:1717 length:318 start_codon:yes stop_codon:yes gene_type:complete